MEMIRNELSVQKEIDGYGRSTRQRRKLQRDIYGMEITPGKKEEGDTSQGDTEDTEASTATETETGDSSSKNRSALFCFINHYYKYNHLSSGIRHANARTKVIIFCKSRPSNCTCKENSYNADLGTGRVIPHSLSYQYCVTMDNGDLPFCLLVQWVPLHHCVKLQCRGCLICCLN